MNEAIAKTLLSEYGVLGIIVLIFAGVIKVLDSRHQKTIERLEAEKNEQINTLRSDLREIEKRVYNILESNQSIIQYNTTFLDKNATMLTEIGHLLREIQGRRLES